MVITYSDGSIENIPDTLLECEAKYILSPDLWPYKFEPEYLTDYKGLFDYIELYSLMAEGDRGNVGKLPFGEFLELSRRLNNAEFAEYATDTVLHLVLHIAQLKADFKEFFHNYEKALAEDIDGKPKSNWHLKYGDFNTLMSLTDGDCTKFEQVLKIDAATVYTTLAYKAEQAKETRKLLTQ